MKFWAGFVNGYCLKGTTELEIENLQMTPFELIYQTQNNYTCAPHNVLFPLLSPYQICHCDTSVLIVKEIKKTLLGCSKFRISSHKGSYITVYRNCPLRSSLAFIALMLVHIFL